MMKATALSEPVPREKVHSTRLSDCEIMTVQAQRLSSRRMTVSGKFCASGTAQETYKSIQKLPKPRCQRNAVHSKGMQESKEFQRIPKSLAYRASIQEHKTGVSLACAVLQLQSFEATTATTATTAGTTLGTTLWISVGFPWPGAGLLAILSLHIWIPRTRRGHQKPRT